MFGFHLLSLHALMRQGQSHSLNAHVQAISACITSIITNRFSVSQCLCFCVQDSNAWRIRILEGTKVFFLQSRWIEAQKKFSCLVSRVMRNHFGNRVKLMQGRIKTFCTSWHSSFCIVFSPASSFFRLHLSTVEVQKERVAHSQGNDCVNVLVQALRTGKVPVQEQFTLTQ